ncbi:uncharacterized protein LOC129727812 [Wyeomyia smithii]|uniref:uncharacterized protein LOC129727812 n=1 Tax=Wyeomyia smithii TaxID=174621 RepID=UPI0024680C04|nr:uncharacterized protein LOC129727812 [Wyeomyia smithii]
MANNNQAEQALKRFGEQLQCVICFKFPKNARICKHCSALYCNACIWHWITRPQDSDSEDDPENYSCCPHCRKELRSSDLIKLRFFERIEHLGPKLEHCLNNANSIEETSSESSDMPEWSIGHFTLRNFTPRKGPLKIFSQKVVDDLGTVWRLEVWPRGYQTQNHWISAFVSMVKGVEGNYQVEIELLNGSPTKINFASENLTPRGSLGRRQFVDSQLITGAESSIDLRFRFAVRPVSFEEKALLQQKLLKKLKTQDDRFKGYSTTFGYQIDDFSYMNNNTDEDQIFTDNLHNRWKMGIDSTKSKKYMEFKIALLKGLPGFYEVELKLTHDEDECAKVLSFQHSFSFTTVAYFNMQIRWNQLEEFGFTHMDDDYLEVLVTMCPVHINLPSLQKFLVSKQLDEIKPGPQKVVYYY